MDFSDQELKHAVALFYDGNSAPTLVAKGEGATAEEIIRIAEESGVPLCDNAPLVELLSQLSLGDEIPHSLYVAVAHIISFAYAMRLRVLDETEPNPPQAQA